MWYQPDDDETYSEDDDSEEDEEEEGDGWVGEGVEGGGGSASRRAARKAERKAARNARPVEKFLVKWNGMSYLHVSWETVADLVELANKSVKMQVCTAVPLLDSLMYH